MVNTFVGLLGAVYFLSFVGGALSQEPFYADKTIRIIVGYTPGGGYDTYSRLVARHLGKHIPGKPSVIVVNMPGAASLISANHVYRAAKPDGLTIGHFNGGLFLQQLLEKPEIEFDGRKFEYVGAPAQDEFAFAVHKATGIATAEQWLAAKTPAHFGATSSGAASHDFPLVYKAVLRLPIQLVPGYRGTADIRRAFNAAEVQGVVNSWQSFKATWTEELETGVARIVLQGTLKRHPDLAKVPLGTDFAKTEDARRLTRVMAHIFGASVRPYVVPPGVSKERVSVLRRAFTQMARDPEFLADAKKARLEINPLTGEELEKAVAEVMNLEPALVARLKEILR